MSAASGSDEAANIPDAATCDRLCREFAARTNTDVACGHFFLQDTDWNLEEAVGRFFGVREAELSRPLPETFSLLSWNVDGLDTHNVISRAQGVVRVIQREKPNVIFLQEVVHDTFGTLLEALGAEYLDAVDWCESREYYTVMLLHRETINVERFSVVPFENTVMGRDINMAMVNVANELQLCLLNSHLESCREYSKQRKEQLAKGFSLMTSAPAHCTSFFGGDLNLRDSEVGRLPEGVVDLWEANGSSAGEKFTWDAATNTNIRCPGEDRSAYRPRCRFDRVYMKAPSSAAARLRPAGFRLVGRERIRSALCHPSDHFGVLCTFTID